MSICFYQGGEREEGISESMRLIIQSWGERYPANSEAIASKAISSEKSKPLDRSAAVLPVAEIKH